MAKDKAGILEVIEQLMHRLDIALLEASLEPEDPPGF
jgi:hypothetical protein